MNESSGHSSYVDTATCKDRKRRESRPVSSPEDSEKRTRHAVSAVCVARNFVRFGCSCTLPVRPCSLTMRAHVSCHPAHPSPRPTSLSADRLALPVLVPVCFCRIPNAMHVSWPVALGAKAPPHHLLFLVPFCPQCTPRVPCPRPLAPPTKHMRRLRPGRATAGAELAVGCRELRSALETELVPGRRPLRRGHRQARSRLAVGDWRNILDSNNRSKRRGRCSCGRRGEGRPGRGVFIAVPHACTMV